MAINTSQLWAAVEPVVRKFYGLGAKSIKPVFDKIYDVSKGAEPVRHSVELGGSGQLVRKTEGSNISSLTIRQGNDKTWLYDVFAGRIELTFELARDNKVREIKQAATTLGRSVKLTPEYTAALGLDNAFDSASSSVTADGAAWCSTAHSIIGTLAATGANTPTTSAALSETSLEDAYTALMTMLGPDGLICAVNPKKLIVPAALALTGKKLTMPGYTLGTANNDPKVVGDDLDLVVENYMTSTTKWFIKTDYPMGLWWEWDIEGDFMEDQVMTNLNKAYIAVQRSRYGLDDWRGLYGNNPT